MGTVNHNLVLTVQFAHLQDDPATIEKNFVSNKEVECYPYGPINVLEPTLMLKYPTGSGAIDYQTFNYFYIVEWDRYYFMNPPTFDSGIVYISGKEDVLMTFKDEILAQKLLMARIEDKDGANHFYADGLQVPSAVVWTSTINFPNGFNSNWVLDGTGVLIQAT